jgi:hypothetical protein
MLPAHRFDDQIQRLDAVARFQVHAPSGRATWRTNLLGITILFRHQA